MDVCLGRRSKSKALRISAEDEDRVANAKSIKLCAMYAREEERLKELSNNGLPSLNHLISDMWSLRGRYLVFAIILFKPDTC